MRYPIAKPQQLSFADQLFYQETITSYELPDLSTETLPIYRVQLIREGEQTLQERAQIHNPEDAASVFSTFLEDKDREYLVSLLLDTKNYLIGLNVISIGTLNQTLVEPREVYKPAMLTNSASLILCHNHPTGDPEPSPEDRTVTKRLKQAGEILGVSLLDHIIVGEFGTFYSIRENEGL